MSKIIGSRIEDLDTPALLIDLPAMQRNIERMASAFRGRPCQLRPHFKNNKCTHIARLQLAAGSAVGMTCAKLAEAEALADAGIKDVLIANQMVGTRKLERLVELARRITLTVAVDDVEQATALSKAADGAGVVVGVLVEVDIGMGRCGVAPGASSRDLALKVAKMPGLRFDGLQAYEGHLVSVADLAERRAKTLAAFEQAIHTRRMIDEAGVIVRIISGGSTATFDITGRIDGINELQAGTYVTMDASYKRLRPEFENALSVAARVISRPKPDVAVADVGMKGVSPEFGPPLVKSNPDAVIPNFTSEEHCVIHNIPTAKLGDLIELIPGHACTTCNLHRELLVHEAGRIVDVWPIEASGRPS